MPSAPASFLDPNLLAKISDLALLAHVDLERRAPDLGRHGAGAVAVAIEHRHRSTVARQTQHRGPTDPRRAAGHERDLSIE